MDETVNWTEDTVKEKNIQVFKACARKVTVEGEKPLFICRMLNCGGKTSDETAAIRHLKKQHPEIHNIIEGNKARKKKKENAETKVQFQVKVSEKDILNAIVEMIAFDGVPFALCNSSGLQKLIEPFAGGFKSHGINFSVNEENIKIPLKATAASIKHSITSKVKGKPICLMLDIATRFNRSVLGINIGVWFDGRFNIYTIGMHTLQKSHTSKYLFEVVKKILSDYGIAIDQILSVTTDGGRNVKKISKLMNEYLIESRDTNNDNTTENEDEDDANEDSEVTCTQNENEVMDSEIFDDAYYSDLLKNIAKEFTQAAHTSLVTNVSCVAHILHLVIIKAVENCDETKNLLDKCRSLVKKLRTPSFRTKLKEKKCNMPIMDVPTRWSSIFHMV